jgi:hypothetical protein
LPTIAIVKKERKRGREKKWTRVDNRGCREKDFEIVPVINTFPQTSVARKFQEDL